MKLTRTLELTKQYANCPDCGNGYLGNGEGTLNVDDNTFVRTCKCGFKVEIKED